MTLRPIQFHVDPAAWTATGAPSARHDLVTGSDADAACAFCGSPVGSWQAGGCGDAAALACALCALPQRLERPRIDQEAVLVWLPEYSQQAISVLMRELHVRTQALGESLRSEDEFGDAPSKAHRTIHVTRTALAERAEAAERRLGTTSPHELALALLALPPASYAKRTSLLGGIRLLPLGCFYEGGDDVYPKIVAAWRTPPQTRRGSAAPHIVSRKGSNNAR